jgi:hypothetical protein
VGVNQLDFLCGYSVLCWWHVGDALMV